MESNNNENPNSQNARLINLIAKQRKYIFSLKEDVRFEKSQANNYREMYQTTLDMAMEKSDTVIESKEKIIDLITEKEKLVREIDQLQKKLSEMPKSLNKTAKVFPRIERSSSIDREFYYLYTENFSVNITELSKVVNSMEGYTSMPNLLRRLQAAILKPCLDTTNLDTKTLGEATTSINYLTEFIDCFSILE